MRFSQWDWKEHGFTLSEHYLPLDVVNYAYNFEQWRWQTKTFDEQRQAILEQGLPRIEHCIYEPDLIPGVEDDKNFGFVYFFAWDVYGPFKIGSTLNPCGRLKDLQTALPYRLREYKLIFCNHKTFVEAELHSLFRSRQMIGEWFNVDAHSIERELDRLYFRNHYDGHFPPMQSRPSQKSLQEKVHA